MTTTTMRNHPSAMTPARLARRHGARWLFTLGMVVLGLLSLGTSRTAWAVTPTTCHAASLKGVDGPVDYGAYCWIDFTPLDLTEAKSASGQDFQVNLPGGAYLTFTLKIDPLTSAGDNMYAVPVPSWSGAAFGNSAFNGIPGNPVLYQDQNDQNGPQDMVTLSNLILHANGTTDLPFVFVAADGESSNENESLTFTTTGDDWTLVAAPGISDLNRNMPILDPATQVGSNTGSQTVTETGTTGGADGEGSYVFTTNNSPGTVTAKLVGSGLQGVIFGVKYHTIGLSLTKTHAGDFKLGGTGSYVINVTNTVTYPTINPPSGLQPVRVVDTLPTGLTYVSASGSGWACTDADQVITCNTTSLQDLTTSKTFPPITVGVNVANDAPATLTNNAMVSDPTTSTLVFNVCEVENNGICPNSATSSTGDPTGIIHPDLSTSTKTVVDKNGGDAEPGDVLEYTITLKESAGIVASNISVTDDMPLNVGSLTVTDNAGGTDNSTTTGGANGTGQLDITGISVPANGTKTIVYDVTIAAGTAAGTTIDNTAIINNPNGAGATPSAPTVTVKQSQIPASGNKLLYVYDNLSLTRTPQSEAGSAAISIDSDDNSADWTLASALQRPLTFTPGSTVSVNLMVECDDQRYGDCENGNDLEFTAALYDKNGTTLTQIGNTSDGASFNHTNYTQVTANITGVGGTTVAAGHQLVLRITNTTGSRRNNYPMLVEQYGGGERSTVNLDLSTVIKVDSVGPYNDASCTTPVTPSFQQGATVHLCAVVSDPFGSFDIDPASGGAAPSIAITDASSNNQVTAYMTQVADSGAATKTFEYTYTIPTTTSYGDWTATVTAWEGTEHTVTRSANGIFNVQAPHPSLATSTKGVVDLNGGDAEPGDVLEYTITLKESAGYAATDIGVTDDIPLNVGNLTVTDDAGGTDNSTTTGGTNGTGYLDISGISVPANGSVSIVYDVTIAAGTPVGTAIGNSATITGPTGTTGGVPSAPTVIVSQSQVPSSGNKILYLYDDQSMNRTPQSASGGNEVNIAGDGGSADWTLSPTLAKPLTITANQNVSVTLLVECDDQRRGGCSNGTSLHFTAALYDKSGTSLSQIGSTSAEASFNYTSYQLVTANIPVGSSDYTVATGHQLLIRIINTTPGSRRNNYPMLVEQYDGGDRSTANVHVSTVINVDSVATYDDVNCTSPITPIYETNDRVFLCAVVSDPFGSYDIDPTTGGTATTITITDTNGAKQLDAAVMTLVNDSGTATKTYEYTYYIPASPPNFLVLGNWSASVTATEGNVAIDRLYNGNTTISDSGLSTFDVEAPDLLVVKSVTAVKDPIEGTSKPKALPGATMRYTTIVTNQGKGPVDANQLVITDPIPAHTVFVVGSVSSNGADSGLSNLTASDISYSNDGGVTWSYIPSGSTDPAVTNIKFNPQGSMNGKSGATAPAYTISFNVILE